MSKAKRKLPKVVISSGRELDRIAASAVREGRRNPRFGVLFLVDPVRAIEELGYRLSRDVRTGIYRQLGGRIKRTSAQYERVRTGKLKVPWIVRLTFKPHSGRARVRRTAHRSLLAILRRRPR